MKKKLALVALSLVMVFSLFACETEEKIAATGIIIIKTTATLEVGESLQLSATVSPETATDRTVAWSSGDTAIATVSADGLVTAVKKGEAKITAKNGELKADCSVTVTDKTLFKADFSNGNKGAFAPWNGAITENSDGTITVMPADDEQGSGAMTLFNKTQTTKNDKVWIDGGYTVALEVYIDTTWDNGEFFAWTVALNNSENGGYLNETFIRFQKYADGVRIKAYPGGAVTLDDTTAKITASGFYTITTKYYEAGDKLAADISVKSAANAEVYKITLAPTASPTYNQALMSQVGALRYGWLVHNTIPEGVKLKSITASTNQ